MALHQIVVESNIINTAIYCGGLSTKIAVLECDTLSIYQWDLMTKPVPAPCFLASTKTFVCEGYVQQVALLDDEQVLVLATSSSGSTATLFRLTTSELKHIKTSLSIPFTRSLCTNLSSLNPTPYFHFSSSGRVAFSHAILEQSPDLDSALMPNNTWEDISILAKQMREVKVVDIWDNYSNKISKEPSNARLHTIVFGLTFNGSLYANGRRLAKDCTSFLVTSTHLIFINTQYLLKFVHMAPIEGKHSLMRDWTSLIIFRARSAPQHAGN